jgi:putative two-component system response regulator
MTHPAGTSPKPTILVVDDTPDNLALMSGLLKDRYKIKIAPDGENALRIAGTQPMPDLILLDVMMPDMDGYEVCRRLKDNAQTRHIPVIFLTSKREAEDERRGLATGAVDYLTKPVSPPIALARIETHLQLKEARDYLADRNAHLEKEVARRTQEISTIQDVAMMAMASLAETRDNETGNHIRRTQHYVKILAGQLKDHPRFRGELSDTTIELLYKSAPLHDIGKVGIPDNILLKPGKLEPEEFDVMKTHTTLGRDALAEAENLLQSNDSFLRLAREIIYSHHEKWDGSGYPQGLAGDAIPLSARLMALADVYDALVSKRVYKAAMPHEQAVAIIQQGKGSHFDPDIVEAFKARAEEFRQILARFYDA